MKNFRARKQKSGKVFYYFDLGGKPRKELPLGADYIMAVRKWSELMQREDAAAAVADFKGLADRYERDVLPLQAKSTQATRKGDMKMLREFFCTPTPAPLDSIKPSHIAQMLQWKRKNPTTANRLKRVFGHMFNMARAWGYTDKENPCTGVRGFELGKRDVYVTDQVFRSIWQAAPIPLRDAMDLAYLTGQRPGDTLQMTERDIADGMLAIRQNKTAAKLRIKVEGELLATIERITKRKAAYKVWCANLTVNLHGMPLTKQTLRKQFEQARKDAAKANPSMAAEIEAVWFYDLRAKAADDTAELHGDQAAANLLGHDSVSTTRAHYLRRGKTVSPTK